MRFFSAVATLEEGYLHSLHVGVNVVGQIACLRVVATLQGQVLLYTGWHVIGRINNRPLHFGLAIAGAAPEFKAVRSLLLRSSTTYSHQYYLFGVHAL